MTPSRAATSAPAREIVADQSSKVDDTGAQRARTHRVAWMGAAAVLALAIFIVDSFTPFGIAIAVLYVVVLLLANQVASRNGLILIATGCMALTVVGFLLDHGHEHIDEAAFRALISLAAIAITTVLLLRGRKVIAALEESEARYRMFLNISSVSFWRLDVSRLNDMFATLRAAGVTRPEAVCRRQSRIRPEGDGGHDRRRRQRQVRRDVRRQNARRPHRPSGARLLA